MSLNESDFASDTDDDDYVPEGDVHEASEEENSGEDENVESQHKIDNKKKKSQNIKVNARASMFDDGESEKVDWGKELEKERKELNEEKEKKKVDDLWASFKKDTESKKPTKTKSAGSSLTSLFDEGKESASSSSSTKVEPNKTTKNPTGRFSSLFDDDISESDSSKTSAKSKPRSLLSNLFNDTPAETHKEENSSNSSDNNPNNKTDQIEITKVYDFAGEAVKVSKQVSAESDEAKKYLKSQEESNSSTNAVKRPSGLAGVVGSITKKAKMGCLDKSKLDWNKYVDETGIREELSTFNKGKEGYVEKQMFLERADLRQFEHEKAVRDKNRKSLMK